jgi:hypothetical protein
MVFSPLCGNYTTARLKFRVDQFLGSRSRKLYISSPYFIERIPLSFKGKIVYDSMDDMIAFAPLNRKENMLQIG